MTLYDLPRWQRRLVTVPTTLLATTLALVFMPALALIALVLDLATGPRRLRWLRLLAMGLHYLVLESLAIAAAAVGFVVTGFGLAMRTSWSVRLHLAFQHWWTRGVLAGVRLWLGATIRTHGGDRIAPGPVVIAAHHRSFFDAVVPSVVAGAYAPDVHLRHTLKKELLLSPALDLFGHRTRNHFVDRMTQQRTVELAAFRALARGMDGDALVVFPEGTFYSPKRLERRLSRIRRSDPTRAERIGRPRHVLPVQRGGLLSALAAAPTADLVVMGHRGFGDLGSFREIFANVPFRQPVEVEVWRIERASLPADDDAALAAIDEHWLAMDRWIDAGSLTP